MWIFRVIELSIFCPFVMTVTTMTGDGWTHGKERARVCDGFLVRGYAILKKCERANGAYTVHGHYNRFGILCFCVLTRLSYFNVFRSIYCLCLCLSFVRFLFIQFNSTQTLITQMIDSLTSWMNCDSVEVPVVISWCVQCSVLISQTWSNSVRVCVCIHTRTTIFIVARIQC